MTDNERDAQTIREALTMPVHGDIGGRLAQVNAAGLALARLVAALSAATTERERLANRAVCSGCGQDVDEGGGCYTQGCEGGEMIPASDLPWALDKMRRAHAEEWSEWLEDNSDLEQRAEALAAQLQQAREALQQALEYLQGGRSGFKQLAVNVLVAALRATAPAATAPFFGGGILGPPIGPQGAAPATTLNEPEGEA